MKPRDEKEGTQEKLSVAPYKGMRDFYPEDLFLENHLFKTMRETAERSGYEEYQGPLLEPTELYASKTSEEIVRDQSYTFIDRGERSVTLRPEMTPTLARMVAARRRDLAFPLRWYSIANLFRYEQPQKGRLREHFQWNVDMFGVESLEAEIEVIAIASQALFRLGATEKDFEIRLGSRALLSSLLSSLSLSAEKERELSRCIDRKDKMPKEEFHGILRGIVGSDVDDLITLLEAESMGAFVAALPPSFSGTEALQEMENILLGLRNVGVMNARFSPSLVRGFDYYSGLVFEIFDTDQENRRAIAGGGRYDRLLSIFGEEKIPAVGFGMGDVTLLEFLRARNLLPAYHSPTTLVLCQAPGAAPDFVETLAEKFRNAGINTAIDYSGRKVGDQIRSAVKHNIPYLICIGEKEKETGVVIVKNLSSEEEQELSFEEACVFLQTSRTS